MADEEVTEQAPADLEAETMAKLDRERLPVESLAEAIPHLRRPFTPEAIRFKVQNVFKDKDEKPIGCMIVAYIDQRLVSERLNRVIPDRWSAEYKTIDGSKLLWCRLTVDGVSRTDIGESSKGLSKDLVSDALKRAAVPFGVGVSCYALPEIKLFLTEARGRIEVRKTNKGPTIVLTEHGHVKLREGYAKWLEEHGVRRFGPPLDHGDVVGSTIEEEFGIGTGEGDGSEPGWSGLSVEQAADIEALLEVAETFGAGMDRAAVQMRLNGRPEAVEAWLEDTKAMLAARKDAEVAEAAEAAGQQALDTDGGAS